MTQRCIWSHEKADDLLSIRLPDTDAWGRVVGERVVFVRAVHEQRVREFADRQLRHGRLFLAVLLGGVLGLLGFGAAGWTIAAGSCLVGMGLTVLWLPFATPQTVEAFGIRASIVMARIGGVALMLLGGVIAGGLLGA